MPFPSPVTSPPRGGLDPGPAPAPREGGGGEDASASRAIARACARARARACVRVRGRARARTFACGPNDMRRRSRRGARLVSGPGVAGTGAGHRGVADGRRRHGARRRGGTRSAGGAHGDERCSYMGLSLYMAQGMPTWCPHPPCAGRAERSAAPRAAATRDSRDAHDARGRAGRYLLRHPTIMVLDETCSSTNSEYNIKSTMHAFGSTLLRMREC